MRPRALLFANTDWYLFNFRKSLGEAIKAAGWDVVMVSPNGAYGPRLRDLGFEWIPFEFSPGGVNPLREIGVVARLARLYRSEKPDLAHHFTIKCVIYGSLAARLVPNTAVVNAVTGAGYVFSQRDVAARVLRYPVEQAYRMALSRGKSRVVFQNSADQELFVRRGLVQDGKTSVIRGSGVNCSLFRPPEAEERGKQPSMRVLLATRLLRDKGISEYSQAAEILRRRYPTAEFLIAGDLYPHNPAALDEQELEAILGRGAVRYLGHVSDMPRLLRSVDVVVLPTSYAEGTPRILIEAAASGRPVVTTDVPGCRGLVEDGQTGFLLSSSDPEAIAEALARLFDDDGLRESMGRAGREVVLEGFEESIVLRRTFDVYRELIHEFPTTRLAPAHSESREG